MNSVIKFQKEIKVSFKDKSLILEALTHKSANQKTNVGFFSRNDFVSADREKTETRSQNWKSGQGSMTGK